MSYADTLVADEDERAKATREFTLRAIREGSDPINHWIIRMARDRRTVPVDDLEEEVGISKAALSERVNDLVQVGLVERTVEGDAVQPTVLAEGFLGIVDDVSEAFGKKLADDLERD